MRRITSFIIMLLLVIMGCTPKNPDGNNPVTDSDGFYSASAGGVTFKWKYDGADIDCKVSAPTLGWVAVGFEPSSMMLGADIMLGYYSAGAVTMRDDYGSALTSHTPDTSNGGTNDILNASGTESAGVTEITFRRAVNTGDPNDKVLTQGVSRKIIMSYGSTDDFSLQHASRGAVTLVMY